eukprot:GHVU01042939.1.p1 GENE.GHVU01042939.1~~GHVU01042939.1.p1  ORF type:complete len:2046 (+),score=318.55 GHVU01042939.1:72-6140(+)
MEEDSKWFHGMLCRVRDTAENGGYQPLPMHVYDMHDTVEGGGCGGAQIHAACGGEAQDARGATPSASSEAEGRSGKTYVICGGFGGICLVVAEWLVHEGATDIALLSRSGAPPKAALDSPAWKYLSRSGVAFTVHSVKCDVSKKGDVVRAFAELKEKGAPPVRGIFHAAGVTADAALGNQTPEAVEAVYEPKVRGAWNLHEVCEELGLNGELEIFLMFSSVAALFGNFGQTNYAAANSCLDALVQYRRSRGLCGQSIQWGPWIEQGMAAELKDQLAKVGMRGISNDLGVRVLAEVLRLPQSMQVVSCAWVTVKQLMDQASWQVPFFERLRHMSPEESHSSSTPLLALPVEERQKYVTKVVTDLAASVLEGAEVPSLDAPIEELGIDSLGAVEFRNALQSKLGVKIPTTVMFDYPTLNSVIEFIMSQVAGAAASPKSAIVPAAPSRTQSGQAVLSAAVRLPPDCKTVSSFWDTLMHGKDCIRPMPLTRWDYAWVYEQGETSGKTCYVKEGGFMDNAEYFDNGLFSLSVFEVSSMDPQQRMMLEIVHQAICEAGYTKETVMKADWGVWMGCCNHDWTLRDTVPSSFTGTGISTSLVSNRISYIYGLKGPSMTVDTACSSSLVAMDAAIEKLRRGTIPAAIVGGINLMLTPHIFMAFCKARMLSPDCRCKAFDARANGYVRGEGGAAVVLVPLEEARRENKRIWAIVRGSATNHDGRSASLTAPNGPAQQDVIRAALRQAGVLSTDVSFVEAHGTGTALGDPIEVGALKAVYGAGRSVDNPLVVGAVKTNFGHLEGASGIAGFVKVLLCLRHREMPPNLHFESLNPHIDVDGFDVVFPKYMTSLPQRRKIYAGLSSFGFGGTNAHVVIEEPPAPANDSSPSSVAAASTAAKKRRLTAFLFTGQGSQYVNMGASLMKSDAAFRGAMDACCKVLDGVLPKPLLSVLYPNPSNEQEVETAKLMLNQTLYAQVALFCLEYAIASSLKQRGITPDVVIGHSLGEYVAATVVGILSLADGLRLVYKRAEIMMQTPARGGAMAACRLSRSDAEAAIKAMDQDLVKTVALAAINGPKNIVLSGAKQEVEAVLASMQLSNRSKYLSVSHAFHSPLMHEAVGPFQKEVSSVQFGSGDAGIKFISTVTSRVETDVLLTPEYWARHISVPVNFFGAMQTLAGLGSAVAAIEIGPKPTLTILGKQCAEDCDIAWFNSIDPNRKGTDAGALRSLEEEVVAAIAGSHEWNRVTFPWTDLSNAFIGTPTKKSDRKWTFEQPLTGRLRSQMCDHVVAGTTVIPGAGFLEMFGAAAELTEKCTEVAAVFEFEDIEFEKPMMVPDDPTQVVVVRAAREGKNITVGSSLDGEFTHHASAKYTGRSDRAALTEAKPFVSMEEERKRSPDTVDVAAQYKALAEVGLAYGPTFRTIRELRKGDKENNCAICIVAAPPSPESSGVTGGPTVCPLKEKCRINPAVLDGAFQSAGVLLASVGITTPMVPVGAAAAKIGRAPPNADIVARVTLLQHSELGATMDVTLWTSWGCCVAHFDAISLRHIDLSPSVDIPRDLLWEVEWKAPAAAAEAADADAEKERVGGLGKCLAFGEKSLWSHHEQEQGSEEFVFIESVGAARELESVIGQGTWGSIVILAPLSTRTTPVRIVSELLSVVKKAAMLLQTQTLPPIFVVCRRDTDDAGELCLDGTLGFLRSARLEIDNQIGSVAKLYYVAVNDGLPMGEQLQLAARFTRQHPNEREVSVTSSGTIEVPRLAKSTILCTGPIELHMHSRGALSALRLRPMARLTEDLPKNCLELRVRAIGLNFRDVLNVMGLYPGDPGPPGGDCAGTVVSVGSEVKHLEVGDSAVGIAPGYLKTYVATDAQLTARMPAGMTFEQACAFPVVGVTVEEYALGDIAQVKAGDKVLIHASSGGVGITAIHSCKRVGAVVHGTAGNERKQDYVLSLRVEDVTSSRDAGKFKADMNQFLGPNGKVGRRCTELPYRRVHSEFGGAAPRRKAGVSWSSGSAAFGPWTRWRRSAPTCCTNAWRWT